MNSTNLISRGAIGKTAMTAVTGRVTMDRAPLVLPFRGDGVVKQAAVRLISADNGDSHLVITTETVLQRCPRHAVLDLRGHGCLRLSALSVVLLTNGIESGEQRMTRMYAKLTKNCCLRGWTDVQYAIVNWNNAVLFELSKKEFYVAEACDGQTDFHSLAFLPEHHAILEAMMKAGIAEPCREVDSIEFWQQYRKANNPLLKVIHWCVTGLCNLNCRHCYMQSPSGKYGQLSLDDMVRLIEQFEQANVVQVSLTGGEPFMRKDLLYIMTVLAQKRIGISEIYSNGTLITDKILDGIKTLGFSPHFQISFDGFGAHEYFRAKEGIEERVIDAIRKVRAAGFPVIIASCIDRVNVGHLGETYDMLRGLDIQAWRVGIPMAIGNWRGATTDLSLDEQANAYAPLVDRWLKDGRPFEMVLGQFVRASAKGNPVVAEESAIRYTPESYDCGSCRKNLNLLPDGTLLPCALYVDSTLENCMPHLLYGDLSKIWTDSILRELADMKKRNLLSRNVECGRCELFGNCGMGCRASALRKTGSLMAKDPLVCDMWKGGYKQRFHEMVS